MKFERMFSTTYFQHFGKKWSTLKLSFSLFDSSFIKIDKQKKKILNCSLKIWDMCKRWEYIEKNGSFYYLYLILQENVLFL